MPANSRACKYQIIFFPGYSGFDNSIMSQKIYLRILRWGVYLALLSIFLVFKNFFFPYITSKQIFFNIVIEILFVFWLAFIIKYPAWRPKKSWLTIGLVSFFIAIFLSCLISVDFNLSFWGDIERMLGLFHLLHFLVFYFIIITVMKTWADWRNLFLISVGVAVIVSLYGIGQRLEIIASPWGPGRIIATIGNAAYVGAYAIFNLYFVAILFFKEKNNWAKFGYIVAGFLILLALIFSGTRGAYLGFGISILIALPIFAILNKNRKIQKYSLASLVIFVIMIIALFSNVDSSFVKNNSFLTRASSISLKISTVQTRFISWKAAWLDFNNHPLLGTGYGNYAITFDKYFEPTFYNYTRAETYFDRAHNNLVDIVSTTGLLGLFTYLSIFVAAGFYLVRGFRKKKIGLIDFSLLSALIIAYFIQNLLVFDALVTYICLMITLGYIYYLSHVAEPEIEDEEEKTEEKLINKEIYALAIIGVIMLAIIYQFNIKPIWMLTDTIKGQIAFAKQDMVGTYGAYQKALSYNTVLDRDSRDSFVKAVNSGIMLLPELDQTRAQEILDYAVELAKINVEYNFQDSLMQTQLASTLNNAARLYSDDPEKFYYYADQAQEAINNAIASSPGRIPLYFTKAQIQLTRGEDEDALATMRYAVSLNLDYYESSCQLSKIYFMLGQEEDGYKEMDICLDKGGSQVLNSVDFISNLINHYTEIDQINPPKFNPLRQSESEASEASKVLILYKRLTKLDKENIQIWINLAVLYAQAGMNEEAKSTALQAVELDKSYAPSVDKFIRSLE